MKSIRPYPHAALALMLLCIFSACSTRRNTTGTRFYHAMTTRYNVYFNGNEAYKAGVQAQEDALTDSLNLLLNFYPIPPAGKGGAGQADFDRAIEKAQKAIRTHSIRRKPRRRPGGDYPEEYRRWLQQKEFNPFLHNAWMLLGKAQQRRALWEDATATFGYVARLYDTDPSVRTEALIRLAECHAAQGHHYEAEEALARATADTLPPGLRPLLAAATAQQLLASGQQAAAIPHVERAAKAERSRPQRARLYYLLGQLHQQAGHKTEALAAYKRLLNFHTRKELQLAARTRMSEVAAGLPLPADTARARKLALLQARQDSLRALLPADPQLLAEAALAPQREDSLYRLAREAYKNHRYDEALRIEQQAARRFPRGNHRSRFLFLSAMAHLQTGRQDACLDTLRSLSTRYPSHQLSTIASGILQGVESGKLLSPSAHSFGSLWQQRGPAAATTSPQPSPAAGTDTTAVAPFRAEEEAPFLCILAYEDGQIDERLLLYEVARFNFSSFLVESFDLSFHHERGIGMLHIAPFDNYGEAHRYLRRLYAAPGAAERLSGLRAVLISEANYRLMLEQYSFDDYDKFYRNHYLPLPDELREGHTLDEPLLNLPPAEEEPADSPLPADESPQEEEDEVIFQ